jgi:hypothetical protein
MTREPANPGSRSLERTSVLFNRDTDFVRCPDVDVGPPFLDAWRLITGHPS